MNTRSSEDIVAGFPDPEGLQEGLSPERIPYLNLDLGPDISIEELSARIDALKRAEGPSETRMIAILLAIVMVLGLGYMAKEESKPKPVYVGWKK
jgi:hypothetical protein